ncbi:MAG: PHP domain-containing protein, partial [Streptosporangiaceae bacterium]
MSATRHTGRWTQDDRCGSPWHYLPVEVPAGAAALRVELDYDRSGAVLDLGCFGPGGFRGWSGGARSSFVITPGQATPGYLPGELEPGLWQVVLGLYRLPAEGTGYSVTASVSSTP